MRKQWLTSLAVAMIASPSQLACTEVECGEGTIERDGDCVARDEATNNGMCGAGTVLENGVCVGATTCDPDTTTPEVGEGGRITCTGAGELSLPACDQPLPCPPATSTTATVCGRLFDLENTMLLQDSGPPTRCDNANLAADGPCSLDVQFFDAVPFATGGGTAGELPYENDKLIRDSCGRFRVTLTATGTVNGFVAVGARPAPADTTRKLSGVVVPAPLGAQVNNVEVYSMRTTTDMAWSTSAGLASGTFASKGVYVSIFRRNNVPVAGVTMVGPNSNTTPSTPATDQDYYFSDTDPDLRRTATMARDATGANGTGLLINMPPLAPDAFGGSGTGVPENCSYPNVSGGVVPGVVFVQVREMACR
jgi:hypothetical protein